VWEVSLKSPDISAFAFCYTIGFGAHGQPIIFFQPDDADIPVWTKHGSTSVYCPRFLLVPPGWLLQVATEAQPAGVVYGRNDLQGR
jgi:hypothetical protein